MASARNSQRWRKGYRARRRARPPSGVLVASQRRLRRRRQILGSCDPPWRPPHPIAACHGRLWRLLRRGSQKASAVASPMPLEPPVMNAAFDPSNVRIPAVQIIHTITSGSGSRYRTHCRPGDKRPDRPNTSNQHCRKTGKGRKFEHGQPCPYRRPDVRSSSNRPAICVATYWPDLRLLVAWRINCGLWSIRLGKA